jgi:hypothetical protein
MKLGFPSIIVQNKSKRQEYYPNFQKYQNANKFD